MSSSRWLLLVFTACSSSPAAMTDGAPVADTWTNYAANFFVTYCDSCHDAQDPTGRDFSVQTTVAANMAVMRCGVAAVQDPSWNCGTSASPRQFPIGNGPKPTDAERARLVAWITAGEP